MWFGKTVAGVPDEPADLSRTVDEYLRAHRQKVHTRRRCVSADCHSITSQETIVKVTCGDRKLRGAWSLSDETVGERTSLVV